MMKSGARVSLLVVSLASAACGAAFSPKRAYASFSRSTKQLIEEQKYAQSLRQRKKAGECLDYAGFDAIQCANGDVGKVVNVLWLGLYAKFYTPLAIYFYPGMLPSTFESPALRAKRFAEVEKKRRKGLMNLLGRADDVAGGSKRQGPYDLTRADVETTTAALKAASKKAALAALMSPGVTMPDPALFAASLAMEGPYKFLPRWMHKRAVKKGLETLKEGDDALRNSDVPNLPLSCVENACAARGLLRPTKDEMTKGLTEWLKLSEAADATSDAETQKQTRLALLAINTAASVRASAKSTAPGVALLYSGKGF